MNIKIFPIKEELRMIRAILRTADKMADEIRYPSALKKLQEAIRRVEAIVERLE
jgi:hypothetical protein